MTNEQLFDDLKQFIAATVSQQTSDLAQRMDVIEANMATKDDLAQVEQHLTQVEQRLTAEVKEAQRTLATLSNSQTRILMLGSKPTASASVISNINWRSP